MAYVPPHLRLAGDVPVQNRRWGPSGAGAPPYGIRPPEWAAPAPAHWSGAADGAPAPAAQATPWGDAAPAAQATSWGDAAPAKSWGDAAQAKSWPEEHRIELKDLDWLAVRRESVTRCFLSPREFARDAEERREELGIRLEEDPSGDAWAPVSSFEEVGVLPQYALDGLRYAGITSPMPIQAQALPLVLQGRDVIGIAQTGSGKTLAFLLPAITHIEAQRPLRHRAATPIVLVLAPTRELAVQISDQAKKVLWGSKNGKHRDGVWAVVLYGGGNKREQQRNLRDGCHIVVATPGRLIDFLETQVLSLERVTYLVLDEADRMLDMGFQGDVALVSGQIRPERQVLFFSATWSAEVQLLAAGLCHEGSGRPTRISVGQDAAVLDEHGAAAEGACTRAREGIRQEVVVVDYEDQGLTQQEAWTKQGEEKERLLMAHLRSVLNASSENKALVFVSQKQFADDLSNTLAEDGFEAGAMHGGRSQDHRLWTLEQFRTSELRLLVATDVLGRGIDIPNVSHVVVHEMGSVEDYIHRIGRTARGRNGEGHALVFFEYYDKMPHIAQELIEVLNTAGQHVPEDLRRIAAEVASGKRKPAAPRWGGRGAWSASGWGAG